MCLKMNCILMKPLQSNANESHSEGKKKTLSVNNAILYVAMRK